MNRRTFLATAACATAAPVFGQPKEKVKIVSSLPRFGNVKWQTDQMAQAIQMAVADFEKTTPFAVEYLDWNDANARLGLWDDRLEQTNCEKAIADKEVVAYIGPYHSGATAIAAPLLNAAGLVQLAPSASLPGLTRVAPNTDPDEPDRYRPTKAITLCRVCPHDASQGSLSADFAAEELKAKSVHVLDDKDLYGTGVATGFAKRCQEMKVKVLGHESIAPQTRDFGKLLKAIKAKEPDLLYFGGTVKTGAVQLTRDMLVEQLGCPLMVPDGCYDAAFVEGVGADVFDVLKCFVTVPGLNVSRLKGRGEEFVNAFKEKHKATATAFTVYAYECAAVVLEALRATGKKDREAIRKAVVATKDFDKGLIGKWSLDANGDNTQQPLTVATIEKGKFRAVRVLTGPLPVRD